MDQDDPEKMNSQLQSVSKEHSLAMPTQKPEAAKSRGCGTFLLLASVIAAASGFMLGYEMGLISGAVLQLREVLSLSCRRQELVVSSLLIGALLVSLGGGFILDHYGRKFCIILSAVVIVLATVVLIGFVSYATLIAGRVVTGMAVALSGSASCLYIAEMAPQNKRGLLVCLYELMVVIGILLGFGFSYAFASVKSGWKYMFAAVIPPAVLQAVAMLFLPVSPRFLIRKGKHKAAHKVLAKLRMCPVDEELRSIQTALRQESQSSLLDLFRTKDNMRVRLMMGVALVFFQQVTGQPNVLFYASTVLKSVGFHSDEAATLASTGLGVVKVAATVPAVLLADRVGSRTFLCVGSAVMAMSLATLGAVTLQSHTNVIGICQGPVDHNQTRWLLNASAMSGVSRTAAFSPVLPDTVTIANSSHTPMNRERWIANSSENRFMVPGADLAQSEVSAVLKWLSLVSLLLYVAAFSISLGPMAYVVLSEIFPMAIRGKAVSVVSAVNWGTNLVISLTFLTVTEKIGLPSVIFSYAAMSLALLVFVIFCIPETKGMSLERISQELAKRNHLEDRICYRLRTKTDSFVTVKQSENS